MEEPRWANGRLDGARARLGPWSRSGGGGGQLNHVHRGRAYLGGNPVQIGPGRRVDSGALSSGTAYPPACDSHDHIAVFRAVFAHERPAAVPLPRRIQKSRSARATFPAQKGRGLWAGSFCSHVASCCHEHGQLWQSLRWCQQLLWGCEKGRDFHGFSCTDREETQTHVSLCMVLRGCRSVRVQVGLALLHSGEER